jgi:hypothetical protein
MVSGVSRFVGDAGGDARGLVAGEEVRRRPSSQLLVEIDEANA